MAKKVTKKALLASVLSLSICTTMLIGTSYAWFTDSVTSSGNIIKSGTLDVAMQWAEGRYDPTTESDDDPETDDIVWYEAEGDNAKKMFDAEMLWEPGYTAARHIRISNEGSLALKYNLTILAKGDADDVADLASVIDVYTKKPAVQVSNRDDVSTTLNRVGTLRDVLNDTTVLAAATQDHLLAGEKEAILTLALKMQETAGNEYQNKQVNATFDVVLYATQYTEETDSFDKQYDKLATYDSANVGNALTLVNRDYDTVTQVTVPASAAQVNDVFELSVTNSGVNTEAGKSTLSLDITLTKNGVALDIPDINNTEYAVEVYVGKNLNLTAVKHNGTPVNFTYDAATGIVSFKVTSFSPFTVEYNAPKTITFVGGEGTTGTMEAQSVFAGVEATLTDNSFEKTGYSFAGWATTAGGAKAYDNGEAITVTENTTLYALWNANPYEVVFNAQGGTGDMANQTIKYGASANLTANAYTKTGHDFMGWTATEGGTTVDYADQASYTMNTLGATLYAVWTANDYDVIFNGNGATSGSMQAQTFTFGTSANLTANAFAKTGYSFAGWATSANGEAVYADTQLYTMSTEGATLYATWAEIKPTGVTIKKNGTETTAETIKDNETLQLIATVSPDTALDTSVAWSTSDADVATVSTNGLVTAKAVGTATITATCNGDNDVTATCTVTVEPSTVNVKYMDYNPSTNTFTEKTQAVPVPNKVTSAATAMSAGWYYVEGTVENANRITVTGTVNLILCDGAQLTASKGITVNSGNTLNIYAQTNGTGKLTVTKPDYQKAGIGGGPECDGGNVTINGGTVTVTGGGDGAGIGGGYSGDGGNVTINGGTVTATGKANGAGIGGGNDGDGGNVTINGGTVTANGGMDGAGIGGGKNDDGGNVTINDGTVTANGGTDGAGIGGGYKGAGGNVTINGGTVTATGSNSVAGIGGGYKGTGGNGTLTVAEGLGVFGGDSANPTAEIEAPYTSRPRYMVVKKFIRPISVSVSAPYSEVVGIGLKKTLTATVLPNDATDKSVTWSSSNTAIATVNAKTGEVTGVSQGTVQITATTINGISATCTMTVNPVGSKYYYHNSNYQWTYQYVTGYIWQEIVDLNSDIMAIRYNAGTTFIYFKDLGYSLCLRDTDTYLYGYPVCVRANDAFKTPDKYTLS